MFVWITLSFVLLLGSVEDRFKSFIGHRIQLCNLRTPCKNQYQANPAMHSQSLYHTFFSWNCTECSLSCFLSSSDSRSLECHIVFWIQTLCGKDSDNRRSWNWGNWARYFDWHYRKTHRTFLSNSDTLSNPKLMFWVCKFCWPTSICHSLV